MDNDGRTRMWKGERIAHGRLESGLEGNAAKRERKNGWKENLEGFRWGRREG